MVPTAVSEILEAVCKLVIGLTGALLTVWWGMREYETSGTVFGQAMASPDYAKSALLPVAAAMAILGVTVGSLVGFLYLLHCRKKAGYAVTPAEVSSVLPTLSKGETGRRLTKTALPIGLGALAVNLAGLVDTTFLQMRMGDLMATQQETLLSCYAGMIPQINLENGTVPNFLYGCYSQALTLFMVVPSVTQAFGISALPSVTNAYAGKNKEALQSGVTAVLRLTCLFCIPAGLGLSVLSYPISTLVFGVRPSMEITARVLSLLGVSAIFAALSTPINSMLQAVGRVDLPVKLLVVGLSMKAALNYILSGIPQINLLGAAIGTLCCYVFLTVAGLILLLRVTKVRLSLFSILVKPFFASLLCCAAAYVGQNALRHLLPAVVSTGCALVIAVGIYLISLWLLCAIHKSDLTLLRKGKKT